MIGDQLSLFARFYYRPSKAASDALDQGSFGFAVCCVVAAVACWWTGLKSAQADALTAAGAQMAGPSGLALVFLVLLPISVGVIAVWESLGSVSIVLRREYFALLICGFFAWSAAYLPFGVAFLLLRQPLLAVGAHVLFIVLLTICVRTALGASLVPAIAGIAAGWAGMIGAMALMPVVGSVSYFLMSPWVLYILYQNFSPDVRSLGDSVSSRRNFRRQLEASMLNPRDADAHYQLGLIYLQRRQYDDAEERFRKAVAIQPQEADYHLQLGRVLTEQGKNEEALRHFQFAVQYDKNVSRGEGWRDLGSTLFKLGRLPEAGQALSHYTDQRPYDPEGLYYYGATLKAMGKSEQARGLFQQAIEAVHTAPSYRRGQLRKWARLAKSAKS